MRIVIAGGKHQADFLIKMFLAEKHDLIVINKDEVFSNYISTENDIPVFQSDPSKAYALSDAAIDNADILIALSDKDTENYVICKLAKKLFNVKKCVCIVSNPKNVRVFKKMGIDSVISSTYLLGQTVKTELNVEKWFRTLSIEDEKIVMTEIVVEDKSDIVNKRLMDILFPKNINISCVFRDPDVIIPNGHTVIKAMDKLIIISKPEEQDEIVRFIHKSS
jgi:trk system potassium uptake protein TrkA